MSIEEDGALFNFSLIIPLIQNQNSLCIVIQIDRGVSPQGVSWIFVAQVKCGDCRASWNLCGGGLGNLFALLPDGRLWGASCLAHKLGAFSVSSRVRELGFSKDVFFGDLQFVRRCGALLWS